QLAVHEHFPEQEPRAERLREQSGVLAHPAEARALRPSALEDGACVRVPERARAGEELAANPALEREELVPHDAVVVLAGRVAGDATQALVTLGVALRRVAERRAQGGPPAADQALGVRPAPG